MNDVVTHKSGFTFGKVVFVFMLLYLEFIKKKIYKEKTIHHIITAKVTAFPGSSLDVTIFVLHITLVEHFRN